MHNFYDNDSTLFFIQLQPNNTRDDIFKFSA